MNDLLFNILEVMIISAVVALLRYAVPYLTQQLRAHNYNFAADIVEKIVRCAEQTLAGTGRGEEKFRFVCEMAKRQFERYGIPLTDDQLIQLIEAAVQAMNAEVKNGEHHPINNPDN